MIMIIYENSIGQYPSLYTCLKEKNECQKYSNFKSRYIPGISVF